MDKTTIVTPNGTEEYWHYSADSGTIGNVWRVGLLKEKKVSDGGNLLQREQYVWDKQPIALQNENNRRFSSADDKTNAPQLLTKTITRDGTDYVTDYLTYDSYGNPTQISENGNGLGSQQNRTTNITYYENTSKWIIRQIKTEDIPDESNITRTFYSDGNLKDETRNGLITQYTYHSTGDIETITDPRNKVTTYLNYSRGQAQTENHPEGVTITRIINYDGTVKEETNGEGNTTKYQYDDRGRITEIDPPGNRVAKTNTTYTWAIDPQIGETVYANSVTIQGPYKETITFDGFGRALETKRRDTNRGITITSTAGYDEFGRKTFQSYPGDSSGTTFTYDPLGRTKTIKRTGAPQKVFEYLSGNRIRVTDERGKISTYTYRSYGDPDERVLTKIEAPEGITIDIVRNTLGQIETIAQDGYTRTYTYYPNKYLESIIDPETGTTVFGRDNNGNMTSRKVGNSAMTIFQYDDLNRQDFIDYPVGMLDVTKGYDDNSNLTLVDNGTTARIIGYGETDQKESEDIILDGITYHLGFQYDNRDSLEMITYPSGRQVTYDPDAFGRPTEAASFASSVSHHPTGQLKSIIYTNGYRTDLTLDSRKRIDRVYNPVATSFVDRDYGYDDVGNVTSIIDNLDPGYTMSMLYDDVNRLEAASGNWGAGSISYTTTGNIDLKTMGSNSLDYHYGLTNHRLESITGTQTYVFGYDDYGNITSDGQQTYTYDDAPNLQSVIGLKTVFYEYDGNNNRMREDKNGVVTYYMGTNEGVLYGTYDILGVFTREYIYLDGNQIAMVGPLDTDGDGLSDESEAVARTDPNIPDTDGDGLLDGDEVYLYGTSPIVIDTDNDGFDDKYELDNGADPLNFNNYPPYTPGDINGDGNVNVGDLVLGQRHILGLTQLDLNQVTRGDIHPDTGGDGQVIMPDMILLLQQVLMSP